jgi:hypothetical protein
MILQPGETFAVVRQLADPSDGETSYVRAAIRNAKTDELIKLLPLTDRGDRRFSATWEVPQDPSGLGFYVAVVTTVYADSGYSTPNLNYGEEASTYLVDNRFRNLGGGGGGDSVDYRKIEKLIAKAFGGIKIPDAKDAAVDLGPVLDAVDALGLAVSKIPAPVPAAPPDMAPLASALAALAEQVGKIPTSHPSVDLSPVLEALGGVREAIRALPQEATPPADLGPVLAAIEAAESARAEDAAAAAEVVAAAAGIAAHRPRPKVAAPPVPRSVSRARDLMGASPLPDPKTPKRTR